MKVTRELRTARQVMSPIECRGFVAQWDERLRQLILHGATQFPHVVRTGLSQVLGLPEIQIRVISPDVGGGFGYKAILAGGGDLPVLARHAVRPSGALAGGSPRAADRERELPRASLS